MINQHSQSDIVRVDVVNYNQLFDGAEHPLAVDTYQRGFVWDEEKIKQLISDLEEYSKVDTEQPPYYMGTILVHEHDE